MLRGWLSRELADPDRQAVYTVGRCRGCSRNFAVFLSMAAESWPIVLNLLDLEAPRKRFPRSPYIA